MTFKCLHCKNYIIEGIIFYFHGKKGRLMNCYSCQASYIKYIVNKLVILEQIPEDEMEEMYGFGGDILD